MKGKDHRTVCKPNDVEDPSFVIPAQFILKELEKIRETVPLSALTGGVHLHHLRCPDEEAYRRVCQELDRLGVLYTQNGETGD